MTPAGRTEETRIVRAPRAAVYAACVDPARLAAWRFPDGMSATVHGFDARAGGAYRMTLTYTDPDAGAGKTTPRSDSFTARFLDLVPEGLLPGVRPEDNATGTRMALANLARLVEPGGER